MKITKKSILTEIKTQLDKMLNENQQKKDDDWEEKEKLPSAYQSLFKQSQEDGSIEIDDETLSVKSWNFVKNKDNDTKFRWLSLKIESLSAQIGNLGDKQEESMPPQEEEDEEE